MRRYFLLRLLLAAGLLGIGLALLATSLSSYENLRPVMDRVSKDGSMESFTPELFERVRFGVGIVGSVLLALGATALAAKRSTEELLTRGLTASGSFLAGLPGEARQFVQDAWKGFGGLPWLIPLLAILLLGAVKIGMFLSQPMRYDEAYTYLAFALRPFRYLIADYHLPNNHVFHSVLVRLAYLLLGNQPWVVRLPAYLASVLSIPATFLVASQLYNRRAGLLSAGLLASTSAVLEYATNARGYSIVMFFGLLILGLGIYLKEKRSNLGWLLFVLFSVLGFYTQPVMLYPFGMVMAWLFFSALNGDTTSYGRWKFVGILFAVGVGVVVLTLVLYTPVFLTSGVDAVTGNRWISSMEWGDFSENVQVRLLNTWRSWILDLPSWAEIVFAAGVLLSLGFHFRISRQRIPLLIPGVLWIAGVLAIQQVAPWPRIWLFALPLFFIISSAGLLIFFDRLLAASQKAQAFYSLVVVLAAGALALSSFQAQSAQFFKKPGNLGEAEELTLYLQERLQEGDVLAMANPANVPVRYYFDRYGIPETYLCQDQCPKDFRRLFVYVNVRDGQSLERVLRRNGLGKAVDTDSAELVYEYKAARLYILVDPAGAQQ